MKIVDKSTVIRELEIELGRFVYTQSENEHSLVFIDNEDVTIDLYRGNGDAELKQILNNLAMIASDLVKKTRKPRKPRLVPEPKPVG